MQTGIDATMGTITRLGAEHCRGEEADMIRTRTELGGIKG